jgi:hypothetical protein
MVDIHLMWLLHLGTLLLYLLVSFVVVVVALQQFFTSKNGKGGPRDDGSPRRSREVLDVRRLVLDVYSTVTFFGVPDTAPPKQMCRRSTDVVPST